MRLRAVLMTLSEMSIYIYMTVDLKNSIGTNGEFPWCRAARSFAPCSQKEWWGSEVRRLIPLLSPLFRFVMNSWHRDLAKTESSSSQSEGRGLVDLVDLVPFDVKIVLTENTGIETFAVTDLVTAWLNSSMERQLNASGYVADDRYATFDSVILLDRENIHSGGQRLLQDDASWLGLSPSRRFLQEQSSAAAAVLYTARFEGVALFARDTNRPFSVPVGNVLEMQRTAISNDADQLLQYLVDSSATGLGAKVADVTANLNPVRITASSDQSNKKKLDLRLVIFVAVAVAIVALLFLVLAIGWAWYADRRNRAAYLRESKSSDQENKGVDPTGSDTTMDEAATPDTNKQKRPPFEVYGHQYDVHNTAASVRSEDIESSLQQYYKSGLGSSSSVAFHRSRSGNDNGSVSSMESYGYSLDGYAPTVSTPLPSDAAALGISPTRLGLYGTDNGQRDNDDDDDDEDDSLGHGDEY
jgi:hypothetical protein